MNPCSRKHNPVLAIAAIAFLVSGLLASQAHAQTRRALNVGINKYAPGYSSPLSGCVNDANGIRRNLLLNDPGARWSASNMEFLADTAATRAAIRDAIQRAAKASASGDMFLYSQASHGAEGYNGNCYLQTYNADYWASDLAEDLALFNSDVTIICIIDTCHSGGMFKNKDNAWPFAGQVMQAYSEIKAAQYAQKGMAQPKDLGANIAFMTACKVGELAAEGDGNGFFTGSLMRGCNLSSVDSNGDGLYQYWELHSYASAQTIARNPEQHPQYYNYALLARAVARSVNAQGAAVQGGWMQAPGLYNADRSDDMAVYQQNTGFWYIRTLEGALITWGNAWGGDGFVPVEGDYNGDQIDDLAVYNQASGQWFIKTLDNTILCYGTSFGGAGFTPVPGDYDGDGTDDMSLFDCTSGKWYIQSINGSVLAWGLAWGWPGAVPVPGDFDGDGKEDLAVYDNVNTGNWYIRSLDGATILWGAQFGGSGADPVSGDYNGDGATELAVYYQSYGAWYIRTVSGTILAWGLAWGGTGMIPITGDYGGDNHADLTLYDNNSGEWYSCTLDGTIIMWDVEWGGEE